MNQAGRINRILFILLLSAACGPADLFFADDIVINAVGDVMIGSLFPITTLPPEDGRAAFKYIEPYLTNGKPDLVLANLEGAITYYSNTLKNVRSGWSFAFEMPPDYTKYLRDGHISAVNQANNHAMDFGERGFLDTRKNLDRFGIKYTGLKNEVLTYNIKGKRVAIIGFAWFDYSNNLLKPGEYVPFIKRVAASNDIVIIEFHGGGEGEGFIHVRNSMEYFANEQRGNMIEFCHLAVDSGASLILGSSPHVVRAMEIYKNKLIAYSLGNFITYKLFSTAGSSKYSLILSASIDGNGDFVSGNIIPCIQFTDGPLRGIPHYDDKSNVINLLQNLSRSDISNNNAAISDDGQITRKPEDPEK